MIELGIVVAVIIGVVEAVKRTGFLAAKWSAIFAILLGVVWMWFSGDAEISVRIFDGVVAGLMASGLYSGVKSVVK
jgi:hypothetical protein